MMYTIVTILSAILGLASICLLIKMTFTYNKICTCQNKVSKETDAFIITEFSNKDKEKYLHRYRTERTCAIICAILAICACLCSAYLHADARQNQTINTTSESEVTKT